MTNTTSTMDTPEEPILFFDHPYPRYGLAVTLVNAEVQTGWQELLDDPKQLIRLAGPVVEEGLHNFRVHTTDDLDDTTELQYRRLSNEELETSGQKASGGYYISPHVVIDDRSARYLIKEARSFLQELNDDEIDPRSSAELKRSFAPFTTKLNEGTATLSKPKSDKLEAVFSLVASLTPEKPAAQVDFTNQVMIPDLDLENLIRFVRLFRDMRGSELESPLTLERSEESNRKRPPLFDGNYPDAPRSSAFGPVGLMGAIGQWAKRANRLSDATPVLEEMAGNPVYLVSYDGNLMRQEYVGHHAARLAQEHNLPGVIESLYRSRFYNPDDNDPESNTRKNFYQMAGRFLQLYTRAAFRDFRAFRVQHQLPKRRREERAQSARRGRFRRMCPPARGGGRRAPFRGNPLSMEGGCGAVRTRGGRHSGRDWTAGSDHRTPLGRASLESIPQRDPTRAHQTASKM